MKIESYKELRVYQAAFELAMEVFDFTKSFPPEEKFSMTDQIRRSSRSVCANIAEAWRKRRYMAAFISKINDSETEACETQVWIESANSCQYLSEQKSTELIERYDRLLGQLVIMIHDADKWVIMKK